LPRRENPKLTRQHVWLWVRDLEFLEHKYGKAHNPNNRGVSFAIREIISRAVEWLRNQEERDE